MPDWSTDEILAVHFRMHKAEGELFRDALVRAGRGRATSRSRASPRNSSTRRRPNRSASLRRRSEPGSRRSDVPSGHRGGRTRRTPRSRPGSRAARRRRRSKATRERLRRIHTRRCLTRKVRGRGGPCVMRGHWSPPSPPTATCQLQGSRNRVRHFVRTRLIERCPLHTACLRRPRRPRARCGPPSGPGGARGFR